MKPAIFYDQAKTELDDAIAWYDRCRVGPGKEFQAAVEEAVGRICENPQIGATYGTSRFQYVLVRRFPYVVFYAESTLAIRVMAVAHGRRRPGYWRNRTDKFS
jgi:toxin ParE1/3/4